MTDIDKRKRDVRCTAQLCKAIQEAGGTIRPNTLFAMSVEDFLLNIASPNNIDFIFVDKKLLNKVR